MKQLVKFAAAEILHLQTEEEPQLASSGTTCNKQMPLGRLGGKRTLAQQCPADASSDDGGKWQRLLTYGSAEVLAFRTITIVALWSTTTPAST